MAKLFFPAPNPDAYVGDFPGQRLADGVDTVIRVEVRFPAAYTSILGADAVVVSAASGNLYFSVASDFGAVCTEDYDANSDTYGPVATAVTLDVLECIDIIRGIEGVAADDLVGVAFTRVGSDALDTINDEVYLIGIVIEAEGEEPPVFTYVAPEPGYKYPPEPVRRGLRRRFVVRCVLEVEVAELFYTRTEFVERLLAEVSVWEQIGVVTFRRTPFSEGAVAELEVEAYVAPVPPKPTFETVTIWRVPFAETALVEGCVVRQFAEYAECVGEVWERFEVRSVFERGAMCEGYVYSDIEFAGDVKKMLERLNDICVLLATGESG